MRRMIFLLVLILPVLLSAGGCPGCGGYSGSTGGMSLLGLMGSQFGNYGNNFLTSVSTSEFEGHDSDAGNVSLQLALTHWISLQWAGGYGHTFGEKIMYLDEKFYYTVHGVTDMGLMAWADLPGRTRYQPCPLDGDVTKVPDYWHFMVGVGTTVPTGKYDYKDDWGYYPAEYQLGSGTWDPLASAAVFKRIGRLQPQFAVMYKFSGGQNDIGYWRSDALYVKADLIYLNQPKKKGAIAAGVSWSHIYQNDRNYNWGIPGAYEEIAGTKGDTVVGYISYGMEVTKGLRPSISLSLPIHQMVDSGLDKFRRSVSLAVNYNF